MPWEASDISICPGRCHVLVADDIVGQGLREVVDVVEEAWKACVSGLYEITPFQGSISQS